MGVFPLTGLWLTVFHIKRWISRLECRKLVRTKVVKIQDYLCRIFQTDSKQVNAPNVPNLVATSPIFPLFFVVPNL